MQLATHGITQSGPSFVGPLDDYTANLAGAWSVARRLLSSYEGSLIRIRRSSDNAEQDIGVDAVGDLDTAAITAFVGANSAYVTTIYHQSGGGNLVQTTAASQPRIVDAGTLSTLGGKPAMAFNGSSNFMRSAALNIDRIALYSATRTGAAIGSYMTLYSSPVGATWSGALARFTGRWLPSQSRWEGCVEAIGNLANAGPAPTINTSYLLEQHYDQTDIQMAQNATQGSTVALSGNITDTVEDFLVGVYHLSGAADAAGLWLGRVGEMVIWNAAHDSTVRSEIRTIENNYWSLY